MTWSIWLSMSIGGLYVDADSSSSSEVSWISSINFFIIYFCFLPDETNNFTSNRCLLFLFNRWLQNRRSDDDDDDNTKLMNQSDENVKKFTNAKRVRSDKTQQQKKEIRISNIEYRIVAKKIEHQISNSCIFQKKIGCQIKKKCTEPHHFSSPVGTRHWKTCLLETVSWGLAPLVK